MITTTDTLTYPEQLAREKTIIEVESWFSVLKAKAVALKCRVELESRVQKTAYVYRLFDGCKLGRVWVRRFLSANAIKP